MKRFLVITCLLVLCGTALAVTKTATASGTWTTATWSPAGTPTSSDDVLINNGVTVTCDTACAVKTLACATAGGACVFNGATGGSFTYHGNVTMGSADWTFAAGFSIVHNDDAVTSNHFTWTQNYSGKLVLNGTSTSHVTWSIANGSGYAGGLGGNVGYLHATYADFSDISAATGQYFWLADLSGAGSEWSCDHCTFTRTGAWIINNWNTATTFSLTHWNMVSGFDDGSARTLMLRGMGAKTGGTRLIEDFYYNATGQIVLQADASLRDPGLVVQDGFCYVAVTPARCIGVGQTGLEPSFAPGNWKNILTWKYDPTNSSSNVALDFPGGTLQRTYVMLSTFLNCATQSNLVNYHPSTDNPGVPVVIDGFIYEQDCSDAGASSDLIEHNSSTVAAPMTVKNSISLPAPPFGATGAFTTYINGAGTPRPVTGHNNTIVAAGVTGGGVSSCGYGFDGAGVAGIYGALQDNIFWLPSSAYGCGAEGSATGPQNAYASADHNGFFNISGPHYNHGSAVFATPPGTNDIIGDPQFVESGRNFLEFCKALDPNVVTWDNCRTHFINRDAGFTVSRLIDYIHTGLTPKSTSYATASSTGSYIGAVSPNPPPVIFYSDLITGMCSGGENNKGHWVTIAGNNFGSTQGTSYVQLTPANGGASTTLDTYKYWTNTKIAFQLGTAGGCVANGDYDISIVTANGTSNNLPVVYGGTYATPNTHFHVYSGSTIYFVDTVNGNDSNNGLTPATAFKYYKTCKDHVALAAGNACYFMPGSQDFGAGANDGFAYLSVANVNGASDRYSALLGYPTSNPALAAKIGCANGVNDGCVLTRMGSDGKPSTVDSVDVFRSSFIVIGNFRIYYWTSSTDAATPSAVTLGLYPAYPWHHVRLINNEESGIGFATANADTVGSFLVENGTYYHDMCGVANSKHSGADYLGTNTNDLDVGWITVDMSAAVNGTCHTNKGIELHSTKQLLEMPAPTLGTITATSGGSLTAGTYDVFVTYRSRQYYDTIGGGAGWIPDPAGDCYNAGTCHSLPTETAPSNYQTITINGTTQTAISVSWPAGYNAFPGLGVDWPAQGMVGDGKSTLCNPALAYRVFACKESSGQCSQAAMYLQGESLYANLNAPGNSTSSNFTINSLTTSTTYQTPTGIAGSPPPAGGLYHTDTTGCNLYNVAIHDSKLINTPGYALTLQNMSGKGYIRFYNDEIINSGNNANWLHDNGDSNYSGAPLAINLFGPPWDGDTRDAAEAHTIEFTNNTFYNSGKPGATNGIVSNTWTNTSFGTRTLAFKNNILVQPQSGQFFLDPSVTQGANFVITGDHNLCFGYNGASTLATCPTGWNSGGGQVVADPSFTANGTTITPASGTSPDLPPGLVYVNYNLQPTSSSPAIDAGRNTATTLLKDILGVDRPQGAAFDIGDYEFVGIKTAGPPTFTLTVVLAGTGGGTVTSNVGGINCGSACSSIFNSGASVTLTESPAIGSHFVGWGGACIGTTTCVLSVTSNLTATAQFDLDVTPPPPSGSGYKVRNPKWRGSIKVH